MEQYSVLIKTLTKELGLNQSEVARKSGVSRQVINHFFTNRNTPESKTLFKILLLCGINVENILELKLNELKEYKKGFLK